MYIRYRLISFLHLLALLNLDFEYVDCSGGVELLKETGQVFPQFSTNTLDGSIEKMVEKRSTYQQPTTKRPVLETKINSLKIQPPKKISVRRKVKTKRIVVKPNITSSTQPPTRKTAKASGRALSITPKTANTSNMTSTTPTGLLAETTTKLPDSKKQKNGRKSSKKVKIVKIVKKVYVKRKNKPKHKGPTIKKKKVKKGYVKRKPKTDVKPKISVNPVQAGQSVANITTRFSVGKKPGNITTLPKILHRSKRQVNFDIRQRTSRDHVFYPFPPPIAALPPPDDPRLYQLYPQDPEPLGPAPVPSGNDLIDTRYKPWHFHIPLVSAVPEPVPSDQELLDVANHYAPVFNFEQPMMTQPQIVYYPIHA